MSWISPVLQMYLKVDTKWWPNRFTATISGRQSLFSILEIIVKILCVKFPGCFFFFLLANKRNNATKANNFDNDDVTTILYPLSVKLSPYRIVVGHRDDRCFSVGLNLFETGCSYIIFNSSDYNNTSVDIIQYNTRITAVNVYYYQR